MDLTANKWFRMIEEDEFHSLAHKPEMYAAFTKQELGWIHDNVKDLSKNNYYWYSYDAETGDHHLWTGLNEKTRALKNCYAIQIEVRSEKVEVPPSLYLKIYIENLVDEWFLIEVLGRGDEPIHTGPTAEGSRRSSRAPELWFKEKGSEGTRAVVQKSAYDSSKFHFYKCDGFRGLKVFLSLAHAGFVQTDDEEEDLEQVEMLPIIDDNFF